MKIDTKLAYKIFVEIRPHFNAVDLRNKQREDTLIFVEAVIKIKDLLDEYSPKDKGEVETFAYSLAGVLQFFKRAAKYKLSIEKDEWFFTEGMKTEIVETSTMSMAYLIMFT